MGNCCAALDVIVGVGVGVRVGVLVWMTGGCERVSGFGRVTVFVGCLRVQGRCVYV